VGSVVYSSDGGQCYTAVTGVSGIQQRRGSVVYSSDGGLWYTAGTEVNGIQQ
jgi:hypothetical protein